MTYNEIVNEFKKIQEMFIPFHLMEESRNGFMFILKTEKYLSRRLKHIPLLATFLLQECFLKRKLLLCLTSIKDGNKESTCLKKQQMLHGIKFTGTESSTN